MTSHELVNGIEQEQVGALELCASYILKEVENSIQN
jgi:hypothetical protein